MIFKCFSSNADYMYSLIAEVNEFIEKNEADDFVVVEKSVHVVSSGDNSLIKPTVVVSVWMEHKKAPSIKEK